MLNAIVVRLAEFENSEGQEIQELSPVAYGAIAFAILLISLIVVTRLDLDRGGCDAFRGTRRCHGRVIRPDPRRSSLSGE